MNNLEEKGLITLIDERIDEKLTELNERIEFLESQLNSENEEETEQEDENEEKSDEEELTPEQALSIEQAKQKARLKKQEYDNAMKELEGVDSGTRLTEKEMKKLNPGPLDVEGKGFEGILKHQNKMKRERFDAGFDDEPEEEEDELSEFEEQD